jgi:hypothetical protein
MQQIQLSQGRFALVDDRDYPLLSDFRWCYRPERNGKQGYAVRHRKVDGKDRLCYLHREIMGQVPAGHEVIFRNGDRLDCRRENLRVVTKAEARQHHLAARSNSQSGIKGIKYNPFARTWSVDIYRNGRANRIGTFERRQEAIDAHHEALRRENPDLHTAPDKVDRTSLPPQAQVKPDAGCASAD